MTIYVDALMSNGWNMRGKLVKNCHLFTDGQLDELHAFAAHIGMKRTWFQYKSTPHYDLTPSRRRLAVTAGAVEANRRQAVAIWRSCRKARES